MVISKISNSTSLSSLFVSDQGIMFCLSMITHGTSYYVFVVTNFEIGVHPEAINASSGGRKSALANRGADRSIHII
jgi:hypothetical protein